MEPQFVDVDSFLVFELVGPLAAVLVLRVLPFGTHTAFEEVVVGFVGQLGGSSDVVLEGELAVRRRIVALDRT